MHSLRKRDSGFVVDKILTPLAIIAPLFVLPQVYEVWILRKTDGVSAISWFLMGIMAFLWFLHAVNHKDPVLKINTFLMIIFNFSIALGVILFS